MDPDGPRGPSAGSAAALLERDTEIRQMLEARNARRAAARRAAARRRAGAGAADGAADRPRAARRDPRPRDRPQPPPRARRQAAARRRGRDRARDRRARQTCRVASRRGRFSVGCARWPTRATSSSKSWSTVPARTSTRRPRCSSSVDDSPELDAEIFNMEEFEGADWVLISDEIAGRRESSRRAARGLPGPLTSRARAHDERRRDDDELDDDEPDEDGHEWPSSSRLLAVQQRRAAAASSRRHCRRP